MTRIIAGAHGGYVLATSPGDLTMGQIIRHFDGILAPIGCVSATRYQPCTREGICRFQRIFLDARNYVAGLMDRATLADVLKIEPVRAQEVVEGFVGGEGI